LNIDTDTDISTNINTNINTSTFMNNREMVSYAIKQYGAAQKALPKYILETHQKGLQDRQEQALARSIKKEPISSPPREESYKEEKLEVTSPRRKGKREVKIIEKKLFLTSSYLLIYGGVSSSPDCISSFFFPSLILSHLLLL